MWYRGRTKSHAIRQVLAQMGPAADHHEVVRRLARRRIHVLPNHVIKIRSRLLEKRFWDADVQRDLKRAQKFVAQVGSLDRASAAMHLLQWLDEGLE